MSNFSNFISEDIEAKKTLISVLPTNTKTNIKKYNEKLDIISSKYKEYKKSVKKYIDTKSKTFNIKNNLKDVAKLNEELTSLEHIKFILNPSNTYLEKMGFDSLLYQISNYYDFNFNSLNQIINEFLNKFELAGITLNEDEFDYTCYVHEYMISFLETRNSKTKNYDNVSKIFEKIYWVNPEIIGHIELNFRKLIAKYKNRFNNYITKLQNQEMFKNHITSYEECLEKLKEVYKKLNLVDKENISDIIELAKHGEIDITNYFEDSRVRTSTYTSLMIDSINLDDKELMDKFYTSLGKLKINIEEYSNYLEFLPMINDFKTKYEKLIPTSNNRESNKELSNIEGQIDDKGVKLERLNKKIFAGKSNLFGIKNPTALRQAKIDTVRLANEIYELYKIYDQEYIKSKILPILSDSLTMAEVLHLYYSFDYFKKLAIKKVFEVTKYDDLIKYSDNFDLFAMNPTNIIVNGVAVFEDSNLAKVIMNKYRLDNINLTEETLSSENLSDLISKIQLLLRIKEIEDSPTTVEKIWFMTQVEKFTLMESKTE